VENDRLNVKLEKGFSWGLQRNLGTYYPKISGAKKEGLSQELIKIIFLEKLAEYQD